jgi:hypothetical protein
MRKRNHSESAHPNPWPGAHILGTARQLNERCIEFLQDSLSDNVCLGFKCVKEDPALWIRVDARVRSRMARCPVLLLDLNFQYVEWWNRVRHEVSSVIGHPPIGRDFAIEQAMPMVQEILIEARSSARSMPHAASLVFGMAPQVTAVVARLRGSDIDRIVVQCTRHMRPRWEERAGFWRNLLHAALDTDDQILAKAHLHCLQLLGSEFMLPH